MPTTRICKSQSGFQLYHVFSRRMLCSSSFFVFILFFIHTSIAKENDSLDFSLKNKIKHSRFEIVCNLFMQLFFLAMP